MEIFTRIFTFGVPFVLRYVVATLDGLIYTADAELYNLVVKIGQQQIFSQATLNAVGQRVYQLLALIMMFRLIFVFVTYVVNPDDMVDKTKGYQNIIKKMVIALGLIIVTPWGFEQSRMIQKAILDEGVIEYFVFGSNRTSQVSAGYDLMYTVGSLFITPYKCDETCSAGVVGDNLNNESNLCSSKWQSEIAVSSFVGDTAEVSCKTDRSCASRCGLGVGADEGYAKHLWNAAYTNGDKYDIYALMTLGRTGSFDTAHFYTEYRYPFIGSTLVGIFIGYMLIIMCIDIAVRSVKLGFYELMAPIPIVSYIGPKNGKDAMLNKWWNAVAKTYAELFTRIAGLELAVFFINTLLEDSQILNRDNFFVALFLVLGALTFAKKLPDILKELGINFETGGFSLKKKLEPMAPVAKVGRTLTGAAAGAFGGMMANKQASQAVGRKKIKTGLSTMGGAFSGAFRGGLAGAKQKNGFGIKAGFGAAGKSGQKIVKNAGTTLGGRIAAGAQQRLGLDTAADRNKKQFEAQDRWTKANDALQSYAAGKQSKNPSSTIHGVKYQNARGQQVTGDVNIAQARARLATLQRGAGGAGANATLPNAAADSRVAGRRANLDARRAQGFQGTGYTASAGLTGDRTTLQNSRAQEAANATNIQNRRNSINGRTFQNSADVTNGQSALSQARAQEVATASAIENRRNEINSRNFQESADITSGRSALSQARAQEAAQASALETQRNEINSRNFQESADITSGRSALSQARAQEAATASALETQRNEINSRSFQESSSLASDRAALEAEKANFQVDTSKSVEFTYHDSIYGTDETRSYSIDELRQMDAAIESNTELSQEDRAKQHELINTMINAQTAVQQQEFDTNIATRENELAARTQQERQAYDDALARDQAALAQEEARAAAEKAANDQREAELTARAQQERQAYDDTLARDQAALAQEEARAAAEKAANDQREAELTARAQQERQTYDDRLARDQAALAQEEARAAAEKAANDQREAELTARAQQERQAYDDRLARDQAALAQEEARAAAEKAANDRKEAELAQREAQERAEHAARVEEERRRWEAENAQEEARIAAEIERINEENRARMAREAEEQRRRDEEEIINLENSIAAAEKARANEWIRNSGESDPIARAYIEQMNAETKKMGIDVDDVTIAQYEEQSKAVKDAIEGDFGRRYSEETKRAEKNKEASKPSGGGK